MIVRGGTVEVDPNLLVIRAQPDEGISAHVVSPRDAAFESELQLFSGRIIEVPSIFISGKE